MRPTPYTLVLDSIAPERFPPIQRALAASRLDARDRDAFLMVPEAVALVREMRPVEGVGDGMDQLVAFVHHAFLYWAAGQPVLQLDRTRLDDLLADGPGTGADAAPPSWYVQLPERRVWARVLDESAHEPLDGFFAHPSPAGTLRVLGVLGLRADRDGFSAAEVEGVRPGVLRREDGTPAFSSNLPGGGAAELRAIETPAELLEMGWRSAGAWSTASRQSPPPA